MEVWREKLKDESEVEVNVTRGGGGLNLNRDLLKNSLFSLEKLDSQDFTWSKMISNTIRNMQY